MIWGAIGEFAIGQFFMPVPPASVQLTSMDRHGWVRDYWDRDEWGRFIPGAGIRYT